ncbi:hypothetical protein AMOR_40040 [Anaeromyxobacter oryzae]|uniref:Uncharacterized protein n=1 Tax=Anaeromyxobacter oryzae TaxID=2918170 RepID=A0ABN6MZN1_9BACT|nr:hypothetical protein AMOR_40040 [Anaeromyxobacter oryzae]
MPSGGRVDQPFLDATDGRHCLSWLSEVSLPSGSTPGAPDGSTASRRRSVTGPVARRSRRRPPQLRRIRVRVRRLPAPARRGRSQACLRTRASPGATHRSRSRWGAGSRARGGDSSRAPRSGGRSRRYGPRRGAGSRLHVLGSIAAISHVSASCAPPREERSTRDAVPRLTPSTPTGAEPFHAAAAGTVTRARAFATVNPLPGRHRHEGPHHQQRCRHARFHHRPAMGVRDVSAVPPRRLLPTPHHLPRDRFRRCRP